MTVAYDVWPTLHEQLGCAQFYERTGHLLLLESPEQVAAARARCTMQSQLGIESRVVEHDELHEIEPELSPDMLAALYCPHDGVAGHAATTRAYGAAATTLGVDVTERCAMASLTREGDRVTSVVTDGGEEIPVSRGLFLLSNSEVAAQLSTLTGLELPVWNICVQVLMSEPMKEVPLRHLIGHVSRTVSIKAQGTDRVMISGGWPGHWDDATGSGSVLEESVAGNVAEAIAVYPGLADIRIAEANASHLEATSADGIPVIDTAPDIENLWFATGWSGHGWAIAPVVAEALAQWAHSECRPALLEPFSLRRFQAS